MPDQEFNEAPGAEPKSVHERLAQAVETKAPEAAPVQTWFADESDINNNPAPSGAPKQEQAPGNTQTETKAADGLGAQSEKTGSAAKITDAVKRASAETATLMYDQLLTVVCNIRINAKFKKRFSDEERARVIDKDLEFTEIEKLENQKDKDLAAKWHRLLKVRDKKIKEIPLSEQETKRHEDAFYNYFKIKDIALPPEWLLFGNLIFTTIDRVIETELD